MNKVIYTIMLILLSGILQAQEELIPLDVFAKHQKYTNMKISPTGEYLAFTYEDGTEVKLAVMKTKSKKVISNFEFGENRHVVAFNWLNDDRLGMTVQTIIGWLDGVDRKSTWAAANADGSDRRILWDDKNLASLTMISTLEDDPKNVLAVKESWFDKGRVKLFKVNIYKNKKSYISDSPKSAAHTVPGIVGMGVDLEDKVRFAIEFDQGEDIIDDKDDSLYFHYKDENNRWEKLFLDSKRKYRPQFDVLGMSADNQHVYFISNYDMKSDDTMGLFEFNLITKEIKFIYRHSDVDITGGIFGSKNQLIGVYLEPGYPEIYYINSESNQSDINSNKTLDASFPNQFLSITSRTDNNELQLLRVRSDVNPGEYFIYNSKKRNIKYLASSKPEVDAKKMAKVEPFILKARDGEKMYGQITIPNNVAEKNLPLVVYPHGGPYRVADAWRWDRRAQVLASRGYLVLQLNFRGSGGYGEDFLDAGEHEWGAKMQDDLTDATHWAINNGLADPERICIHGASYGGYASMQAVVKEPDLYKCSIPDAGVYEMAHQFDVSDSFKGYRKANERKKHYMKYTIGGYKKVKERSPVYHVDKLKAALLIVHGGSDVRVPISNAHILEKKLKEAGKPYETLYKDEEGHGFSQVKNRIEFYQTMLSFLDRHIGKKTKETE